MTHAMIRQLTTKMIALAAVAAAVLACSKAEPALPGDGIIRLRARIGASEAAHTKALPINPGQALTGVTFWKADAETNPGGVEIGPINIEKTTGDIAANGKITLQQEFKYETKFNYIAVVWGYHPVGTSSGTNNMSVTWGVDGKTDVLQAFSTKMGDYVGPLENTLEFYHSLSRVEVVCFAEDDALSRSMWGNITKIELLDTPITYQFNYMTDSELRGGPTSLALSQGDYTTDFSPILVPASDNEAVNAAAMVASKGKVLLLRVSSENIAPTKVRIELGAEMKATPAESKIYTFKLRFTAQAKIELAGVSITPWTSDGITTDKPIIVN